MFRIVTHVCQNCIYGNNDKGKWDKKERHWHIYCEKRERYYKWDKYRFCFEANKSIERNEKPEELIDYSRQKNIELGIIISDENGLLKEYKPSQFVIDTAKHYECLNLVGYLFPKLEKPDSYIDCGKQGTCDKITNFDDINCDDCKDYKRPEEPRMYDRPTSFEHGFKAAEDELIREVIEYAELMRSFANRYYIMDKTYDTRFHTIEPIISESNKQIEKWEAMVNG